MKLSELHNLTEAAEPMLLIYLDSSSDQHLLDMALEPFGISNVGDLSEFIDAEQLEEIKDSLGNKLSHAANYAEDPAEISIWSKGEPTEVAVLKQLKATGFIAAGD